MKIFVVESYVGQLNVPLLRLTDNDRIRANEDSGLLEAAHLFRQAIDISEQEGITYDAAVAYWWLGMLLQLQGKFDESDRAYKDALGLIPKLPRDRNALALTSDCHYQLGIIAEWQADIQEACSRFKKSLDLCTEIGDRFGILASRDAVKRCRCPESW